MPVLQFKGKTAVESYHHTIPHHTLDFDRKLSLLPKGQEPGLDGNLIIEGDNLLALKALLPTHAGRVKCIYIDPPYNTGEEGWVYNDNLTQPQFKEWIGQTVGKEGEDACRHDKWCCMMYPRLQLLKELLHPDGAVFISIDDNEYHHLRLLLEEVFGEDGFIATFIWQKRYSRDNRPSINTVHDYILVFARNDDVFKAKRNKLPPDEQQLRVYKNPNDDPEGRWRPIPMTAQGYRKNQMYVITTPTGVVHEPPAGRCWSMVESEYKRLLKDGTRAHSRIVERVSDASQKRFG
jgi:adenine specific DNA methylase Mod